MTYYDSIAAGYEELHKEEQLKKIEIIKKHILFHQNWKILDVGCGPYFADFPGTVIGIDPARKLLEIAKKRIHIIHVVQGIAEQLPFRDNAFMAVISITAVQNFDDIEKSLNEIKRVAKEYIVLSILKNSPKIAMIEECIPQILKIERIVEEDKDIIFFCRKKGE